MKYNARTGNYKKAYEYQQLTNRYSDSLRNVNYINNIADIDYRYKQDTALLKRNIIIANSHAKVSQLRNTATLSISLLVITIIAAASLYGYIRRRNKRKRAEQVAIITQLRMENIRNRFSPHFVFNVLNIVTGALQNGEQQILPLKLLIQVLRQNLLIADQMAIPLKDEIELVRNYLELRRSINSRMPSVNWESDPEIDMNSLLPAMIIQIPVENVIKHASADSVNIQIRSIETLYFEIIIEDDGMGYIPGVYSNTKNDTGTGLRILFRIIELLNVKNTYKMTMDIINLTSINPETHGTCVHIIIPYHYNFEV
jgi:LytS/YehU family sensor histidine kinase